MGRSLADQNSVTLYLSEETPSTNNNGGPEIERAVIPHVDRRSLSPCGSGKCCDDEQSDFEHGSNLSVALRLYTVFSNAAYGVTGLKLKLLPVTWETDYGC